MFIRESSYGAIDAVSDGDLDIDHSNSQLKSSQFEIY